MTDKQKEAIKKLEESLTADINSTTAFSFHGLDLVRINGFSKGLPGHLNCSLRQNTIFQELR